MTKYPRRWLVVLAIVWLVQQASAQVMVEKAHPAHAADDVRITTSVASRSRQSGGGWTIRRSLQITHNAHCS